MTTWAIGRRTGQISQTTCCFADLLGLTETWISRIAVSIIDTGNGRFVSLLMHFWWIMVAISRKIVPISWSRSFSDTWTEPFSRISAITLSVSSVPKVLLSSVFFATIPFETLLNTSWIWRTSSRSVSLLGRKNKGYDLNPIAGRLHTCPFSSWSLCFYNMRVRIWQPLSLVVSQIHS